MIRKEGKRTLASIIAHTTPWKNSSLDEHNSTFVLTRFYHSPHPKMFSKPTWKQDQPHLLSFMMIFTPSYELQLSFNMITMNLKWLGQKVITRKCKKLGYFWWKRVYRMFVSIPTSHCEKAIGHNVQSQPSELLVLLDRTKQAWKRIEETIIYQCGSSKNNTYQLERKELHENSSWETRRKCLEISLVQRLSLEDFSWMKPQCPLNIISARWVAKQQREIISSCRRKHQFSASLNGGRSSSWTDKSIGPHRLVVFWNTTEIVICVVSYGNMGAGCKSCKPGLEGGSTTRKHPW